MKPVKLSAVVALLLFGTSVSGIAWAQIDPGATAETRALYKNLHRLAGKHTLFGHQHATEYGHGWSGNPDGSCSDVKSVSGSHPAVVGFDFNALFTASEPGTDGSTSAYGSIGAEGNTRALRKLVTDTYDRGGVITIAWHLSNPVTPTGFYWNDSTASPAVKHIIPGGSHHDRYKQILRTVAGFALSCKGADGKLAPMIFRPFHEFDGDWFWWGARHCTRGEFTSLWRFTVGYLRDSLHVHNFLYAFSPDNRFSSEAQFLDRYPGDQWVDMVGMDNYGDMGRDGKYNLKAAIQKLSIIDRYARKAGKLAAFTETGLESIPDTTWFTQTLLKVMRAGDFRLCYVLVWRNDQKSATHFYAPFPGHPSVPDFVKFHDDRYTLFESDLKNIYR